MLVSIVYLVVAIGNNDIDVLIWHFEIKLISIWLYNIMELFNVSSRNQLLLVQLVSSPYFEGPLFLRADDAVRSDHSP